MPTVLSKQLLAGYGATVPEAALVKDSESAVVAAQRIGFPLVLKAVSGDIAHKSELGAVIVGIDDEASLQRGFARLEGISDDILVEGMVTDAVAELLVGVSCDPLFGHYLIIGFGGTLVELIGDSEILLFPVDSGQVSRALRKLRTWPLLDGFRGRPAADIEAITSIVKSVSNLIKEHGEDIVELEINPLMVRERGAVVADTLIRLKDSSQLQH